MNLHMSALWPFTACVNDSKLEEVLAIHLSVQAFVYTQSHYTLQVFSMHSHLAWDSNLMNHTLCCCSLHNCLPEKRQYTYSSTCWRAYAIVPYHANHSFQLSSIHIKAFQTLSETRRTGDLWSKIALVGSSKPTWLCVCFCAENA